MDFNLYDTLYNEDNSTHLLSSLETPDNLDNTLMSA